MKISAEAYMKACSVLGLPQENDLSGWELDAATDKQKETIEKFGISSEHVVYKGQSTAILDQVFGRKKKGLCSPKQAAILLRNGYSEAEVCPMTLKKASELIAGFFQAEEVVEE